MPTLTGLRVVDGAGFIAGPLATTILGDHEFTFGVVAEIGDVATDRQMVDSGALVPHGDPRPRAGDGEICELLSTRAVSQSD